MAESEHINILKSGVHKWNSFVNERKAQDKLWQANLEKANLAQMNLNLADLSNANLVRANLEETNLRRANLESAILDYADLTSTIFSFASLNQASFRHTTLDGTNLFQSNICRADFTHAILDGAKLVRANLIEANFSKSIMYRTDLANSKMVSANLERSEITNVNLEGADLSFANLFGAKIIDTTIRRANLSKAILQETHLIRLNLSKAILIESDLRGAIIYEAEFGDTNLSHVKGLKELRFGAPSIIDSQTIAKSGTLPGIFLKGLGLSDWEIEQANLYQVNLTNSEINDIIYRVYDLRATQSIQIAPMFISYSHADKDFVDKIEELLTEKGVRYWRDIHEMKAGRLEKQVDRAMRLNDLVLIVLSEASIQSDWVELEVNKARRLEKKHDKDVLCPIALDDSWKSANWPESIQLQIQKYNILDFSEWKDEEKLRKQFANLINGIDLFYK